jgi:hypothetical protein
LPAFGDLDPDLSALAIAVQGDAAGGCGAVEAAEKENARLKRIVGDQALDIDMLREVARGNF